MTPNQIKENILCTHCLEDYTRHLFIDIFEQANKIENAIIEIDVERYFYGELFVLCIEIPDIDVMLRFRNDDNIEKSYAYLLYIFKNFNKTALFFIAKGQIALDSLISVYDFLSKPELEQVLNKLKNYITISPNNFVYNDLCETIDIRFVDDEVLTIELTLKFTEEGINKFIEKFYLIEPILIKYKFMQELSNPPL